MASNSLTVEEQEHIKRIVLKVFPKTDEKTLNEYVAIVTRKPQDAIDILAASSRDTFTRKKAEQVTYDVIAYRLLLK